MYLELLKISTPDNNFSWETWAYRTVAFIVLGGMLYISEDAKKIRGWVFSK